jgi:DNA polymerase III delta prime subunit
LTDQETEQIKEQAALLAEDGEAVVRILDQARELAGQSADVLKMVEDHFKGLSKKVVLRELSADLEKERSAERIAWLKVMEVEVDKLRTAHRKGDMAGIGRGHGVLKDQLNEYLKDVEPDEEGGVTSDLRVSGARPP